LDHCGDAYSNRNAKWNFREFKLGHYHIPPDAAKELVGKRETEIEWEAKKKQEHVAALKEDEGGSVKAFPSDQWTLEFDLARKTQFASLMHQAVQLARREKGKSRDDAIKTAKAEAKGWQADKGKTPDQIAVQIYEPLYKGQVSKAIVAERLAKLIDELQDDAPTFKSRLPDYLVWAIEHVTQSDATTAKDLAQRADPKGAE
jgi:putative ATP-dependent endonuclease of OLD family